MAGEPPEGGDLHSLLFEHDFVAAMMMYYSFLRTCAGAEEWIPLNEMNGDKDLLAKGRTMSMKEGGPVNTTKINDPKQDMQAVE